MGGTFIDVNVALPIARAEELGRLALPEHLLEGPLLGVVVLRLSRPRAGVEPVGGCKRDGGPHPPLQPGSNASPAYAGPVVRVPKNGDVGVTRLNTE